MKGKILYPVFTLLFLLQPGWLLAATIVVGPGESLRAALDAAASGDTIVLETNETIYEANNINKTLTLTAGEGFTPVLSGRGGLPAMILRGSALETVTLTIDGILVKNGFSFGPILVLGVPSQDFHTGLVIKNSVIEGNRLNLLSLRSSDGLVPNLVDFEIIDSTVMGEINVAGSGDAELTLLRSTVDSVVVAATGTFNTTISQSTISGAYRIASSSNVTSTTITNSTLGSLDVLLSRGRSTTSLEDSRIIGKVVARASNTGVVDVEIKRSRLEGPLTSLALHDISTVNTLIESSLMVGGQFSFLNEIGLRSQLPGRIEAVNVTVTGYRQGIISTNTDDSFTNMLLVGNRTDLGQLANTDSISHSLISDGGIPGVVGFNNNISEQPLLDDAFNLLTGSPGIDAGNNNAAEIGLIDLYGESRFLDGDGDGVAQVDVGASEALVEIVETEEEGNISSSTPLSLNSWGSGFNATFEYEIQESDTLGGTLGEWRLEVATSGDFVINNAWLSGGYNGGTESGSQSGIYVVSNEGQSYIPTVIAGDVLTFTIQGDGSDFESGGVTLNFISLNPTAPATGGCESPVPVSLPFSFDGQGEHCWVVSGNVTNVNSWSTESVDVNGGDFTNQWSNSLPAPVDGEFTILYNSTVAWGHFEINGTN